MALFAASGAKTETCVSPEVQLVEGLSLIVKDFLWHLRATPHHLCAIDLCTTCSILRSIAGAGLLIHEQGGEETARSW